MERVPETMRSDKGTESLGHKVQSLFKSHLICHFVTQNEVKVNYAERAIKTIKGKIYKYFTYKQSYCYIDALQYITRAYNSSVHRSIKMAPAQVTMRKLNSERMKDEERMKNKNPLLSLKLGTLSESQVLERRSQENMIRGGVVNCSK